MRSPLEFPSALRSYVMIAVSDTGTGMPPEVAEESRRSRSSHVSKERLVQWQKKLASKGWLCPNWA